MLFIDFVSWWYVDGWRDRFKGIAARISYWWRYFSIGDLMRTLISPWRQITASSGPDQSIDMQMRNLVDNLVSRVVGFWVRSTVIIAGFISLVLILIINILFVLIWPLLPLLPLVVIVVGVSQ